MVETIFKRRSVFKRVCGILLLVAVVAVYPVAAENNNSEIVRNKNSVQTGGETSFASGWAHISSSDLWYTQAAAKLSVTVASSTTVKAYFDTDLSVMSLPETAATTAGYIGTATLNRAYIKARLPWFSDNYLRLSAGKMPLGWGYGLYFNAGDLIFGADPLNPLLRTDTTLSFGSVTMKKDGVESDVPRSSADLSDTALSSSALSELRVVTDWMCAVQIPFGGAGTAEFAALPPVDTVLNSNTGRFGGRLLFQPYLGCLESFEGGYLTHGDFSKQSAYLAFDGTSWFDYNLCSSVSFTDGVMNDRSWNISFALIRPFTIRTDIADHSLSLRCEVLWYPVDRSWSVFAFTSYDVTAALSFAASYIYSGTAFTDAATLQYAALVLTWIPIQSFEMSLQGLLRCDDPSQAAAVTASVKYSY